MGLSLKSQPSGLALWGAYEVLWRTVSTEDGHALEGAFGFGVRASAENCGRSSSSLAVTSAHCADGAAALSGVAVWRASGIDCVRRRPPSVYRNGG
jgi:hypothetical protein